MTVTYTPVERESLIRVSLSRSVTQGPKTVTEETRGKLGQRSGRGDDDNPKEGSQRATARGRVGRQVEAGERVADICRKIATSHATYYLSRKQFAVWTTRVQEAVWFPGSQVLNVRLRRGTNERLSVLRKALHQRLHSRASLHYLCIARIGFDIFVY